MEIGGRMQGTLFKYGPVQTNVAFVSGRSERHFVLVGGLGDGLLFAPYCVPLAGALQSKGWSLVQTLLSSSFLSYGIGSLDEDANEINVLVNFLKTSLNSKGFVLMGHSTGSQDTVRYAKRFGGASIPEAPRSLGYILQACVSDREFQSGSQDIGARVRLARAEVMVASGKGEEILFRDPEMRGAPICARRQLALAAYDGDDDIFSSDFSDAQLQEKLGHMSDKPTLLLMGGADEFVPDGVDRQLLVNRLAAAIGSSATPVVIPGGRHNLKGSEDELVRHVLDFIEKLPT